MEEILTNQNSVDQSVQANQPEIPISPNNKNNTYKYLFFITIIVLLGVVSGFYFILNSKISQLNNQKNSEISPTQTPTSSLASTPTQVQTESTLTEKDTNNNIYTNNKFGFSLVIPKAIIQSSCQKNQDSTYSLILHDIDNGEEVPFNFFENGDTIYLAGEYFYRLGGEEKYKDGYLTGFICEKATTTFEQANSTRTDNFALEKLKIYAANVKNDNDLEQFIKSKFGSGCKLGEKTKSAITDTYDVKILSDGKDIDESQCPINFAISTNYNPTKGKVVIFELGQDCSLLTKDKSQKCNELAISNSLKFN